MNKVLPWLKAHWPIPALLLVAILAAPTAFYFARQMEEKQVADFQKTVNEDWGKVVETSAKIPYYVYDANGNRVLEQSAVVNEARIKRYQEIWTEIQTKIGGVSEAALKFNKGEGENEHKLLIDGLFPPPPDVVEQANKGRQFVDHFIQFHQLLLNRMRAGEPPAAPLVAQQLNDHKTAFEAKVRAETGHEPGPEDQAKLAGELTDMRIGAYRKRAGEIGVYADVSAFDGVPTSIPDKAPTPAQAWEMQERSWVNQDICAAIATANGKSGGVSDSVVKRLLKIGIGRLQGWDGGSENPAAQPFEAGEDKAPLNFQWSITGHSSGPGSRNKWYDVRTATVEVVVSSQRLPQFLNALCATNFITITDLDLTRADPLADLREGFDYGDENVVRATIKLETVWLREWRKANMPPMVQQALGMDEKVQGGPPGIMGGPAGTPIPTGGRGRPGGAAPAAGGGRGRGRGGDE